MKGQYVTRQNLAFKTLAKGYFKALKALTSHCTKLMNEHLDGSLSQAQLRIPRNGLILEHLVYRHTVDAIDH